MKRSRQEKIDPARRRLVGQLGRFAVYTAPAMTSLLIAPEADAHHKPGHVAGPVDLCAGPDPPPACDSLPPGPCENNPGNPLCQVGSIGGGSSAQFSGEDFAPAGSGDGRNESGDNWNE